MKVATIDEFESIYMAKFRALAAQHGIIVETEKDRASFDLGLVPTQGMKSPSSKLVNPAEIWFQLKGVRASTASADDIASSRTVNVVVKREHLHFWYYFNAPVYLVVYAEATDSFYIVSMKRWIADHGVSAILGLTTKTKTIAVPAVHALSPEDFDAMRRTAQLSKTAEAISGADREARTFLRDDAIILKLSTLQKRRYEMRVRLIKYGSKTRSEVYFEEKPLTETEWKTIRSHWQFMMNDIATVFPYLTLEPYDKSRVFKITTATDEEGHTEESIEREEPDWVLDDEEPYFEDGELIELPGGRWLQGKGSFEMFEFTFRPELNNVGKQWAKALATLISTGFLAVSNDPVWVSVAPWEKAL